MFQTTNQESCPNMCFLAAALPPTSTGHGSDVGLQLCQLCQLCLQSYAISAMPRSPFSACMGFKVSACFVNCCQLMTVAGSVLRWKIMPPMKGIPDDLAASWLAGRYCNCKTCKCDILLCHMHSYGTIMYYP